MRKKGIISITGVICAVCAFLALESYWFPKRVLDFNSIYVVSVTAKTESGPYYELSEKQTETLIELLSGIKAVGSDEKMDPARDRYILMLSIDFKNDNDQLVNRRTIILGKEGLKNAYVVDKGSGMSLRKILHGDELCDRVMEYLF